MNDRKKVSYLIVLLAVAACALYGPSLSGDFVLDDNNFIANNPYLAHPSKWPAFLYDRNSLTADEGQTFMMYRPVTALSLAMNYSVGGNNAFWYHLTSVVLHAANTVLVFLIVRALIGGAAIFPAVAAAALFCLHPAQVESVAYITGRSGQLSLFFCSLAFLFYLPGPFLGGKMGGAERGANVFGKAGSMMPQARGVMSCAAFLLAMFSKESSMFLGPVIASYDFAYRPSTDRWKHRLVRWLPYALIAALYSASRQLVLGRWSQRELWGGSWASNMEFAVHGLFQDVIIAIWPFRYSVCYSFRQGPGFMGASLGMVLVFLVMVLAAAYCLLRRRPESVALVWFLSALAPVSNLFPITAFSAARFLYAPLVGLVLLCGRAIAWTQGRAGRARWAARLGLAVLCAAWGLSTLEQEAFWQDQFVLDLESYAARPRDPCTCIRLGTHYYNWGMLGRAEGLLAQAFAERPNLLEQSAWLSLAMIRMKQNQFREAQAILERVRVLNPGRRDLHRLLAQCASALGDQARAQEELRIEQSLRP